MTKNVTLLSKKEQLNLRNKAKNELERLKRITKNQETKLLIDNFKEKFSVCEIVYKVILEHHQFNKTGKHKENLKITMSQVPYALNYAGYRFNKEFLTKLFGSEIKNGKKSVKKLRDSLTHSLNDKAIVELQERYEELNEYMDNFLDTIDNFDYTS